jgi:hypothetical protein
MLPVVMLLGLLGVLVSARRGDYLLPLWLLAIFLIDPRKAATVSTIPLAILATVALVEVIVPLLRSTNADGSPGRFAPLGYAVVAFFLLLYAPLSAVMSSSEDESPLYAVTAESRVAMSWIAENTPEDAAFVVMPTGLGWASDGIQEWFPVISRRTSVNTVQGLEWAHAAQFHRLGRSYADIRRCVSRDLGCLEHWAQANGLQYEFIYLPNPPARTLNLDEYAGGCCAELLISLRVSSDFRQVYEGPGGFVFARTPAATR